MKELQEIQDRIRGALFTNGWNLIEEGVDFTIFSKTMSWEECKSQYDIDLQVWVSDNEVGLACCGEFGICDVSVEGFNHGALPPYCLTDLKDFMRAIQVAENQLLLAGVPFFSDHRFEVNTEEQFKRNEQLRQEMNLAQIEEQTRAIIWA